MSLVENIARRNNSPMELLHGIRYLMGQGYDYAEIAEKTGLGRDWIRGIVKLLENGEERLVSAVEKGRMPLYIALKIATEDEAAVQIALTEAHEAGQLVGSKLIAVQKLLDRRNHLGKKMGVPPHTRKAPSVDELNTLYANDIKKKKRLVAKAEQLRQVLAYVSAALNKLLRDEHFMNQLKAEGMNDMPQQLSNMLREVR
jgi:RepB plasmid partitioning protein.